jgi:hypothetical protein
MQPVRDEVCPLCGETNGHGDDCEQGIDTELDETPIMYVDLGGEG